MDYAIVYGDNGRQLTIRSLFNDKYQSLSNVRKITILLDTLACFLDCKGKRVMEFKIMQETFDMYAKRTCQSLATQELGIDAADSGSQPAELSAKAVFMDDSRFSFHAGKFDKLSAILDLGPTPVRPRDPKKAEKEVPEGRIPCAVDGCNYSFIDVRRMNIHINRMHTGRMTGSKVAKRGDGPKPCILCSKVSKDTVDLKRHMMYYHKPCKCQQCGEEFSGLSYLNAHKAKVHTELLTCDVCGIQRKGRGRMRLHKINKHMEEHEKPFICSICGKGFAEKVKLKSHQMSIHIRSRPYKCRIEGCSADFNELANRNSHEKSVHKYDWKKQVEDIDTKDSLAKDSDEANRAAQYIQ